METIVLNLAYQYYKLARLKNPTEEQLNQMQSLLELAQYDKEFSCLFTKLDHVIYDELTVEEDQ